MSASSCTSAFSPPAFAVRPFGALIFGHFGDLIGRKYTFLVTMGLVGIGTFFIGVLPGFASWGIMRNDRADWITARPELALGGEYGGAVIYVAEHAPSNKRGYYTSWIETTATLILNALLRMRRIRTNAEGDEAFGWLGLATSIFAVGSPARTSRSGSGSSSARSPLFKQMVEEGKQSKRPLIEAFGQWDNLKIAILALFGATAGEAVVWYGGQFYALFFLTQTLKVPGVTAQIMIAIALAIGTPCFILFGWLSDKVGRKPIMLAGFALAVVTCATSRFFQGITHFANPKLEQALAAAPVTVTADPAKCSFQFKATGTEKFSTPCDVIERHWSRQSGELRECRSIARNSREREDRRADHRG